MDPADSSILKHVTIPPDLQEQLEAGQRAVEDFRAATRMMAYPVSPASVIDRLPELVDQSAKGHVKRIMARIRAFESRLTDAQDVGVQLVTFGNAVTFHATKIGYIEPDLILFLGEQDGRPLELIQHVSQISFLLTTLPRLDPEQPRRRIGYVKIDHDPPG